MFSSVPTERPSPLLSPRIPPRMPSLLLGPAPDVSAGAASPSSESSSAIKTLVLVDKLGLGFSGWLSPIPDSVISAARGRRLLRAGKHFKTNYFVTK
jgi:hypothetical protein